MGIKERRAREREQRYADILVATRTIAAREGWQAATIRRVADALEVSPPTIYEHFSSKEALLSELLNSGYRQCLEVMRAARATTSDPTEAVVRMGRAYWDEAWSSPELYQVMYGIGGVAFSSFPLPPEAGEIHAEVVAAISAVGTVTDVEAAAQLFRAVLHGLVTLVMADRLGPRREDASHLVEPAIRSVISSPSL